MRVFRALAITALAGEVFYLVAMNVFLSTPLFEKVVNATPDVVDIHYARGWSLFPTKVHARGLSIRATDSHVEWILRFDEVDFDCSLLALARQQFRVGRARGSGITFRLRMKVAAPAATVDHVAFLPTIDSLGPVGIIPSEGPSPAEWNDKEWHLWTVSIDDAIAEHVREVWIEDGRFQGDARVTGAFLLKPMRVAFVGPAHVEIRAGSAALHGRMVAEPLAAKIDFELPRFDPRLASGEDLLSRGSLGLEAQTAIPDLAALPVAMPEGARLDGRVELRRVALRIHDGEIGDQSHLEARAPAVHLSLAGRSIAGAIGIVGDVSQRRLALLAELVDVNAAALASIPRATVLADSAALGLGDLFGDLHGRLDVPDLEIPRAAALSAELPRASGLQIAGGSLRATIRAEGWRVENRVEGNVELDAKDLVVRRRRVEVRAARTRLGLDAGLDVNSDAASLVANLEAEGIAGLDDRVRIAANAKAALHVLRWDLGKKTLRGDAALTLTDVTGGFDPHATRTDFGVARIAARARAPSLDLANPSLRGVTYGLVVQGAKLVDARALNRFLPSPAIVAIESGGAAASANLDTIGGGAREVSGRIDLALANGGIRLHETHLAGDFALHVNVRRFDPARTTADLAGSQLAMRNVRVTGASTDTSAWVGDLYAHSAILALAPRPSLDGDFGLLARDAAPILGVLFRDTLPKVVAGLTSMPRLTAVTHLRLEPDRLVVSGLRARGGDLSVRGTYVARADERRAAFVVQKGPFSAGVNVDDGGAHVRFFGLDSWYGARASEALANW